MKPASPKPPPEQVVYATLLFYGAWTAILVMMLTYLLYVSGILDPHVEVSQVTQNWDTRVSEYLAATHSPHGWGWANLLHKGDFANYIGLALIALLTIFCYLFLIVGYGRRKDWIYFAISVIEVVVLSLAASGIFGSGGH